MQHLIDKKEKINLNAAERAKVRKQILISQLRYRDVRQMIAIAEKAREQVEKEYPDIDISEKTDSSMRDLQSWPTSMKI